MIDCHDRQIPPAARSVRRAVSQIGRDLMPLLTLTQCADVLSQNPETIEAKLDRILAVDQIYQKILETEAPLTVKELAISGKDLIAMGVAPGPQMGALFRDLLEMVLENPEQNTREILLEQVQSKMGL